MQSRSTATSRLKCWRRGVLTRRTSDLRDDQPGRVVLSARLLKKDRAVNEKASLTIAVSEAFQERVKGIEPSSKAWEASVLPLNHTRLANAGRIMSGDFVLARCVETTIDEDQKPAQTDRDRLAAGSFFRTRPQRLRTVRSFHFALQILSRAIDGRSDRLDCWGELREGETSRLRLRGDF